MPGRRRRHDPKTKLFYVIAREQCDIFSAAVQPYDPGHAYYGSVDSWRPRVYRRCRRQFHCPRRRNRARFVAFQCGASLFAAPVSFVIDGQQYVAIAGWFRSVCVWLTLRQAGDNNTPTSATPDCCERGGLSSLLIQAFVVQQLSEHSLSPINATSISPRGLAAVHQLVGAADR